MKLVILIVTLCLAQGVSAQCPLYFWGIDLCNSNVSVLRAKAAERGAIDQTSNYTDDRLHFLGPFDGKTGVALAFGYDFRQDLVRVDTLIVSGTARLGFESAAARDSMLNIYLDKYSKSPHLKDYRLLKVRMDNPSRLRYHWRKNTWNQPQDIYRSIDVIDGDKEYSLELQSGLFDYIPKGYERPTGDTASFREY